MARKAQDVTDAELAILQVLWDRGTATVRDLMEVLYPTQTTSDAATVQKLLKRLEQKSCIERNRSFWPHTYRAVMERADLIGRRLQSTADSLCEGALAPLLTHLVKSENFHAADRQQLRNLLDELERSAASEPPKSPEH